MRNYFPRPCLSALALAIAVVSAGCGGNEESKAPEALEVTAAPTTLEEAFASATGELKSDALAAAQYMKNEEYAKALLVLQNICARPELTDDQRTLATRSMLTAQQEAAKAAESGNKEAEKLLRYRAINK